VKHIYSFDKKSILGLLDKYEIDYNNWSEGKSIDSLFDEIENGECKIIEDDNSLFRILSFVGVNIKYKNLTLIEDQQIFKSGKIRRRNMVSSVSEKMISGENPKSAACRGVKEELNIDVDPTNIRFIKNLEYEKDSLSYSGIITKYYGHIFEYTISDSQYIPEGYVENQKDKSTYFVWK
jgi:hypothetical protein